MFTEDGDSPLSAKTPFFFAPAPLLRETHDALYYHYEPNV